MKRILSLLVATVVCATCSIASAMNFTMNSPTPVAVTVWITTGTPDPRDPRIPFIRIQQLDTNPLTPTPYLAGVLTPNGVPVRVRVQSNATGLIVGGGTFDPTRRVYIKFNGVAWSVTQP